MRNKTMRLLLLLVLLGCESQPERICEYKQFTVKKLGGCGLQGYCGFMAEEDGKVHYAYYPVEGAKVETLICNKVEQWDFY